jgi:WD40 repeat protein
MPADNLGNRPNLLKSLRTKSNVFSSHAVTEPVFSSEPLISYKFDPRLAQQEEIIFTVKTTLQLEKNDYQAQLMKTKNLGVFGREAARPYVLGIVAAFPLAYDRLDWTLAEAKWAFSVVEPYGVHANRSQMALATAQSVQLINMDTGDSRLCHNPWLNQGHTVEFSPDGKKLLVGSSGFDTVFEFDVESEEVVWQWFAWDHGFDQSKLGHYVVRSEAKYKLLRAMGHDVLLVDDPEKYPFGIPTRQKPAHLNSACYDSDGKILVTLFHQGAGYVIDRKTGEAKEVISGLSNPHKLSRRKRGGYFISDTKGGRVIFLDEKYRPEYEVSLAGMSGIVRSPQLSEFLQNTTELREDLFACIDIHRSSLWLIDVKRRRYRRIKFPVEWSVHDVASVGPVLDRRIGNLASTQFGKVAAFARQLKTIHHFGVDGREISALALCSEDRYLQLNV